VTVASLPDGYEERLTPLWPGRFARLALFTLEAHDLALSKLARNSPIDGEDVARLARTVPLDRVLLRERYETELRPIIIGDLARHDQTLRALARGVLRVNRPTAPGVARPISLIDAGLGKGYGVW
jgi:hypothetical protein